MQLSVTVDIKKLNADARVPEYAHSGDAGCDLRSCEDVVLLPGNRALVSTGIAVSIPEGYAGFIQPRSGLAAKHGISIVNTPGLIDSHYRGEIKVILVNLDREKSFEVKKGDKICQFVLQKVEHVRFNQVEELDETVRNSDGFGSTGV
ncbi:MAG: dUTP diphosphatase [Actinobacteria bacterium]|nr:dUTP diphosphatase [Actinomycetota bacterium]